jgi:hypothetical protein
MAAAISSSVVAWAAFEGQRNNRMSGMVASVIPILNLKSCK